MNGKTLWERDYNQIWAWKVNLRFEIKVWKENWEIPIRYRKASFSKHKLDWGINCVEIPSWSLEKTEILWRWALKPLKYNREEICS